MSFNFFRNDLGILITCAAFCVGGCGQGWKIASGMPVVLDKAAHHLGFWSNSMCCATLFHITIILRSHSGAGELGLFPIQIFLSAIGHWCLGNSAQDSTMLWISFKHLHVSICIKALPIWEEQESCSGSFGGKRWVYCMTHHVKHDTIVVERVAYREACELSG